MGGHTPAPLAYPTAQSCALFSSLHGHCIVSTTQTIKSLGYALYSFDELKALGEKTPAEPVPPSPEDLCTIMYTSGTTGGLHGCVACEKGCDEAVWCRHDRCKIMQWVRCLVFGSGVCLA
jgi:acyl-coenzyme A synthetase/AMP-(fatty) acid ligase